MFKCAWFDSKIAQKVKSTLLYLEKIYIFVTFSTAILSLLKKITFYFYFFHFYAPCEGFLCNVCLPAAHIYFTLFRLICKLEIFLSFWDK